jgi:hypothetical protein
VIEAAESRVAVQMPVKTMLGDDGEKVWEANQSRRSHQCWSILSVTLAERLMVAAAILPCGKLVRIESQLLLLYEADPQGALEIWQ